MKIKDFLMGLLADNLFKYRILVLILCLLLTLMLGQGS